MLTPGGDAERHRIDDFLKCSEPQMVMRPACPDLELAAQCSGPVSMSEIYTRSVIDLPVSGTDTATQHPERTWRIFISSFRHCRRNAQRTKSATS